MVRFTFVFILLTFLLLLMTAAAAAQPDVLIMDETGTLDAGPIQEHAQPLLNRGASVAIYMKESGGDILPTLEADGLAENGVLRPNLIVIYVALDPQVTKVISGKDWSDRLKNRGEYIRETTLYSNLDAHDYNRVVNDILVRLEVSLQNSEASHDNRIRWMAFGALCIGLVMGSVLQLTGLFK